METDGRGQEIVTTKWSAAFTPSHYPNLCRMREPNLHIARTPTSVVLFPLTPALSLGRGSILRRSSRTVWRSKLVRRSESERSITSCPLSPRERVRVRGNGTLRQREAVLLHAGSNHKNPLPTLISRWRGRTRPQLT